MDNLPSTEVRTLHFPLATSEIRTMTRNGAPWFAAADICRILGHTNPTEAVRNLDDDEKTTLSISEGGPGPDDGARSLVYVDESGLWALMLRSRKPEARRLRKWLTRDVLPSLRRTGRYQMPRGRSPGRPAIAGRTSDLRALEIGASAHFPNIHANNLSSTFWRLGRDGLRYSVSTREDGVTVTRIA